MGIKRRQFLQFAGSALATLGISQWEIEQQAIRYGRVLAQTTSRKLALLVGINNYGDPYINLNGCVNDVRLLQKLLLIHKFGFNHKDIVTLIDEKATRNNILKAFEEHLIKQAKPGDVVVFHFSGHGSQVSDPDRDPPDGLNSTFVPQDSPSPLEWQNKRSGVVRHIMGHTLFLLMEMLKTENVTVVLDCCYAGGGTRGHLRIRSQLGGIQLQISPEEIEYQRRLLKATTLTPTEFIRRRREGIAKGIVIAAAKHNQLAADSPFSGFDAGVFTYAITQYLWQQTENESIKKTFPIISRRTTELSVTRQEPLLEFKPGSQNYERPIYFIQRLAAPPTEAVITKAEGNQVEFSFVPIDPHTLEAFDQGTILSVIDTKSNSQLQVRLEERNGLLGKGKLLSAVKPNQVLMGAYLQEQMRGLVINRKLRVGLDVSLGEDIAQAKQTLQAIERIEVITSQQQEVDCILGRLTNESYQELLEKLKNQLPKVDSIGLFNQGLKPLIFPGSFGAADETVAAAIKRLQPKLMSLLAVRILRTVLNANSSQLKVEAMIISKGQKGQLIFKARNLNETAPIQTPIAPLNTEIQFQFTNNESRDLYIYILVIDAEGEISFIFPNSFSSRSEVDVLKPKQTLLIPEKQDNFKLTIARPLGLSQVLILISAERLKNTKQKLQEIQNTKPLQLIDVLIEDLKENNTDTKKLAALSIRFDINET